jgi:hypothetical protein
MNVASPSGSRHSTALAKWPCGVVCVCGGGGVKGGVVGGATAARGTPPAVRRHVKATHRACRHEEPGLGHKVKRQHREHRKHLGRVARGVGRAAVLDRLLVARREARKPGGRGGGGGVGGTKGEGLLLLLRAVAAEARKPLAGHPRVAAAAPAPLPREAQRPSSPTPGSPVGPQASHKIHPLFEAALHSKRLQRRQHEVVPCEGGGGAGLGLKGGCWRVGEGREIAAAHTMAVRPHPRAAAPPQAQRPTSRARAPPSSRGGARTARRRPPAPGWRTRYKTSGSLGWG